MKNTLKILLAAVILFVCTVPAFAAKWTYVTKDTDGNAWYIDEASVCQVYYGTGQAIRLRTYFIVKMVPGESLSKIYAAKFGQRIVSIIEEWSEECFGLDGSVSCKFYNIQGKLVGRDTRNDADEETSDIADTIHNAAGAILESKLK